MTSSFLVGIVLSPLDRLLESMLCRLLLTVKWIIVCMDDSPVESCPLTVTETLVCSGPELWPLWQAMREAIRAMILDVTTWTSTPEPEQSPIASRSVLRYCFGLAGGQDAEV